MKAFSPTLDIQLEIQAIVDYVKPRWEPLGNIERMVASIQQSAAHDARAIFDGLDTSLFVRTLLAKREDVLKGLFTVQAERDYAPLYDAKSRLLCLLTTSVSSLSDVASNLDGEWDYEDKVKMAARKVRSFCPELSKSLPLGYKAFTEANPNEFDGMYEYDAKAELDAFQGSNVKGKACPHLVEILSIPNLKYDDESQGRSPDYMLVSAIYGHFLNIQSLINTHDLQQSLGNLTDWDEPAMRFEYPKLARQNNLLLQAMLSKLEAPYTEDEFNKAVASRLEFEALPAEEQAIIKERSKARVMEEMRQMFAADNDNRVGARRRDDLETLKKVFVARDQESSPMP